MSLIWPEEEYVDILEQFFNKSDSHFLFNFSQCVGVGANSSLLGVDANPRFRQCLQHFVPAKLYSPQFFMDWWIQLLWTLVFGIMVLVAASGNVIVLWIIMCHRKMRTVTNLFILSLTFADLLLATFNTAFNFVFMLNSHWPFGRAYCIFSNFVANLSVASSVLTISSMSIERYTGVVRPLSPRMSKKTVVLLIVGVWICGFLLSAPTLLFSTTIRYKYPDGSERTLCYLVWPDGSSGVSQSDYMYNIVFLLLTYVIPMIIMGITYSWMGHVLWIGKQIGEVTEQQKTAIRSKQKVVKMLIIMVTLFAVCWLPYHLYFLFTYHNMKLLKSQYVQHVYLFFYWLAMSHSVYNPVVYYLMNDRFRSYFRRILCCEVTSEICITGSRSTRMRQSDRLVELY